MTNHLSSAIVQLRGAVENMRKEGERPSFDDERAAGLFLADAAESVLLHLPAALTPPPTTEELMGLMGL